jgi:uncharacterized membrane protein
MNKAEKFGSLLTTGEDIRSPHRMEAFFDAIYAIVMTILVLGLVYPGREPPGTLVQIMTTIWPQVFHFLLGFFILAAFWRGHHRLFSRLDRIDENLISLSFLILFITCLFPFSTSIAGDFPNNRSAVSLFHLNMLALGSLFVIQLVYMKWANLIRMDSEEYRVWLYRSITVPCIAGIALIWATVSPDYSSIAYLFLPVLKILINPRLWGCCSSGPDNNSQTPMKSNQGNKNVIIEREEIVLDIPSNKSLISSLHDTSDLMGISREELILKILTLWEKNQTLPLHGSDSLCNLSSPKDNK